MLRRREQQVFHRNSDTRGTLLSAFVQFGTVLSGLEQVEQCKAGSGKAHGQHGVNPKLTLHFWG